MENIILKTKDLTPKYNNKAVVDNLNTEIRKGEIELLGKNPWKQKKDVIHQIGYIPQEFAIHGNLKA